MIEYEQQHLDEGVLLRWIDEEISPSERAFAAAHLERCSACQAAGVSLRRDALTVRHALAHDGSRPAPRASMDALHRATEGLHRLTEGLDRPTDTLPRATPRAGTCRSLLQHAIHVAPWQVAATVLSVASLAAMSSLARQPRGDPAGYASAASGIASPVATASGGSGPGLVSVEPRNGRLLIVFPRPSARSSIRLERHGERFAMFGAPHIEQSPLIVLPGELRVQQLPENGADFELRIPASVTQVDMRIGGRTLARWSGSPARWDYGRRIPLQLRGPG